MKPRSSDRKLTEKACDRDPLIASPARVYHSTRGLVCCTGQNCLNRGLFLLSVAVSDLGKAPNRQNARDFRPTFAPMREPVLGTARAAYQARRRQTIELDLDAFGSSFQSAI